MKSFSLPSLVLLVILLSPLAAQQATVPLSWKNTKGTVIQGDFVKIEGEAVVIRKGGKPATIPFDMLSPESVAQARELAAAVAVNPVEAAPIKQSDPEHQRKLAASILGKKGSIEIWRGSASLGVKLAEDLPKGTLELKSLSLSEAPFTEEDASLLAGCDRLENIWLARTTVPALPLNFLRGLTSLEFDRCQVGVDTCKSLGGNKMLRRFSLWRSPGSVGSEIVAALGSCPSLESINLGHTGIGNTSLEPLAKLKSLKGLCLDANKLAGAELAPLGKITSIESLALWHSSLKDLNFSFLANLKNLRELQLGDCKLPPDALARVAGVPTLVKLELAESDLTAAMLSSLGGMKELRYLGLDNTAVSAEGLIYIKPFPNLNEICLRGKATQVSDDGVSAILKACPIVRVINLNASGIGPAGFAHLGGFKALRELRLADAKSLPDTSVTALAHLDQVGLLDLSGSAIADSQLALLAPMKRNLGELYLTGTRITDAAIPALKEMKALRKIDISGTDISKTGMSDLKKTLATCRIDY